MCQGYKPYSVLFSLKQLFGENADKSDANSLKVNNTLYVEIVYPILKGPKLEILGSRVFTFYTNQTCMR